MRPAVALWVALLVAAMLWKSECVAQAEPGSPTLAASLERIRSDPALSNDPTAIDALARQAEASPADTMRGEARMLVAQAWLERLNRPDDGIGELRRVADDPTSDALTARLAARELVRALVARGRLQRAADEALERADHLDAKFVKQILRLARRSGLRNAAVLELALFGALASVALFRARRARTLARASAALRRLAPLTLAFAAYVGMAGGVLASRYEAGNAMPFVLFGVLLVPVVLLASAWAAVGSKTAPARIGRALLCGAGVVATAFVLLDAYQPTYLEGFGL
jgi:hypothetical protein